MNHGGLARIRTLVMLLVFGMGLFGQSFPAVATSSSMPTDRVLAISTSNSAHCPGGIGGHSSMAMTPACAAAFCSVAPAILSQMPTIEPLARLSFQPTGFDSNPGLTVPPTLGPPRPSLHS
jgi:hypothetical protein